MNTINGRPIPTKSNEPNLKKQRKLPGTNIPEDPRLRTRNHGRLEITVWGDFPDDVLKAGKLKDATDALRIMEREVQVVIGEHLNGIEQIPVIGKAHFHVETRVSK